MKSKEKITEENIERDQYESPQCEIVTVELETPILSGSGTGGSDWGDGGSW
ncbi:MAG: hypothetical protein N4A32_07785 [Marinifilaceae bacterium]|jgi:hypothetical protein|nr:hypothetical protein [Marinifilaceae bacterium]